MSNDVYDGIFGDMYKAFFGSSSIVTEVTKPTKENKEVKETKEDPNLPINISLTKGNIMDLQDGYKLTFKANGKVIYLWGK